MPAAKKGKVLVERKTMNSGILRVDEVAGECVKFNIMNGRGDHYRGIAKLSYGDAAEVVAELVKALHGETARVVV